MGVQINDPISVGKDYFKGSILLVRSRVTVTKKDDKHIYFRLHSAKQIGSDLYHPTWEKFLEKETSMTHDCFRLTMTAEEPFKSWPSIPDPEKYYVANYVCGTRYLYNKSSHEFLDIEGCNICKCTETTDDYFNGDGSMAHASNNYQILEFDNKKEAIKRFK